MPFVGVSGHHTHTHSPSPGHMHEASFSVRSDSKTETLKQDLFSSEKKKLAVCSQTEELTDNRRVSLLESYFLTRSSLFLVNFGLGDLLFDALSLSKCSFHHRSSKFPSLSFFFLLLGLLTRIPSRPSPFHS